ncbi:MAG: YqaA family protein [Crocinitomicaceae bacterium]|nr:YqaA family protein [Crocinitomicaceae bacterium]
MDYLALGFIGLFLVCFLAATILPLTSEGVLVLFLISGFDPFTCLVVASAGNILGGLTNYWLGMIGHPDMIKKRFKKPESYKRLRNAIDKYGYWLGLLSWTPILGDPLTIAVGFFRVRFWPFLLLMSLGKIARYWIIIFWWNA